MDYYEQKARHELYSWLRKVKKREPMTKQWVRNVQKQMNGLVPERVHQTVTSAVKQMVHTSLVSSDYITSENIPPTLSLQEREKLIDERARFYKRMAAGEGAGTGAGGFFLGLADFPLLLAIKMKFLFSAASIYGWSTDDLRERLYILHIFQAAFSSGETRKKTVATMEHWDEYIKNKPKQISVAHEVDWKEFQLEYRDTIDLPKMLQMIPGFGALVGASVNYHFLDHLCRTAKNSYRLRWFDLQISASEANKDE